jgi:hypothetical protein
MRCRVKGAFGSVFGVACTAFGDIHARRLGKTDGRERGMVLGEHYFFRTGSDAAVLIILEERSATETRVEIISWAGGEGMFSISQGAHSDYVQDVRDGLANSGFEITVEEEIDYFDKTKSPNLV